MQAITDGTASGYVVTTYLGSFLERLKKTRVLKSASKNERESINESVSKVADYVRVRSRARASKRERERVSEKEISEQQRDGVCESVSDRVTLAGWRMCED